MKVKELYIEIKKSKNYQTYTAGMLVNLVGEEQTDESKQDMIRRDLQGICKKAVLEQMRADGN